MFTIITLFVRTIFLTNADYLALQTVNNLPNDNIITVIQNNIFILKEFWYKNDHNNDTKYTQPILHTSKNGEHGVKALYAGDQFTTFINVAHQYNQIFQAEIEREYQQYIVNLIENNQTNPKYEEFLIPFNNKTFKFEQIYERNKNIFGNADVELIKHNYEKYFDEKVDENISYDYFSECKRMLSCVVFDTSAIENDTYFTVSYLLPHTILNRLPVYYKHNELVYECQEDAGTIKYKLINYFKVTDFREKELLTRHVDVYGLKITGTFLDNNRNLLKFDGNGLATEGSYNPKKSNLTFKRKMQTNSTTSSTGTNKNKGSSGKTEGMKDYRIWIKIFVGVNVVLTMIFLVILTTISFKQL